jgi:hypothetical protein
MGTYTKRVEAVLRRAREAAMNAKSGYVGSEHILLGIVDEIKGTAVVILSSFFVDIRYIREAIEVKRVTSVGYAGDPLSLFSPGARRVLEFASDFTNGGLIGTELLLLGILKEEDGIAYEVLKAGGVTFDRAYSMRNHLAPDVVLDGEVGATKESSGAKVDVPSLHEGPVTGMTLRDWFAGQAEPAMMGNHSTPEEVARQAYLIADAMLRERDRDNGNSKAEAELAGYERALAACYDDRCMALAEGELAAYCKLGVLSKEEGAKWSERLYVFRKVWLARQKG